VATPSSSDEKYRKDRGTLPPRWHVVLHDREEWLSYKTKVICLACVGGVTVGQSNDKTLANRTDCFFASSLLALDHQIVRRGLRKSAP